MAGGIRFLPNRSSNFFISLIFLGVVIFVIEQSRLAGFSLFSNGVTCPSTTPTSQPVNESVCRVDDHVLVKTVVRMAVRPPQTITVAQPQQTTHIVDTFGFPILEPGSAPPPAEEAKKIPGGSQHFYREDGLLEVSPDGPHPIFELIQTAEERWKEKNRKASRTLKEACAEYERRYGRKPPQGFDVW